MLRIVLWPPEACAPPSRTRSVHGAPSVCDALSVCFVTAIWAVVLLVSASRGLWRRRPANAALVAPAHLEPLLSAVGELAVELVAGVLAVDEVAEAAADAALARVEAAAGLAEVGDGAELAVDGARGVPAAVELVASLLGGLFVLEAGVDVSDEV
jgi:hypothetical protein